jgi:uncharacterized BrkB/YihY/UPF0761 family membrane protein
MNKNKHQNQIVWQIYLPMILIILVLVVSSSLLFRELTYGEMDFRTWSDISILVITLPLILSFIFTFILLSIAIYFVSRIKPKINNGLLKIKSILTIISHWINKLTSWITQPVIRIESLISQLSPKNKGKHQE